jgi:hypothetical protein
LNDCNEIHVHIRALIVQWEPLEKRIVQRRMWHKTVLVPEHKLNALCEILEKAIKSVS